MGNTDCTICRIVDGELPSAPVLEDPGVVAFMDLRQPQPGHVLVVTRAHYACLGELPADLACAMTRAALRLTAAIYRALAPAGINLTLADGRAAGQEIMHVHLHIRPRAPGDGVLTVRPCDPSRPSRDVRPRRPHPHRTDRVSEPSGLPKLDTFPRMNSGSTSLASRAWRWTPSHGSYTLEPIRSAAVLVVAALLLHTAANIPAPGLAGTVFFDSVLRPTDKLFGQVRLPVAPVAVIQRCPSRRIYVSRPDHSSRQACDVKWKRPTGVTAEPSPTMVHGEFHGAAFHGFSRRPLSRGLAEHLRRSRR